MDLSGDLKSLQQPTEGCDEMGARSPTGTVEPGDVHTHLSKPDRKKGKKEKVKHGKGNRKERKSGGWRATLLRCFVCGGDDSQDVWEMSAEEERLRIEERIRRNREADLQRFLKVRKVNLKHKENFKSMLKRRKMTEANQEWSALPPRPEEEANRKVAFQDVNARDVWFYEEEAKPRMGQAWKSLLQEIRDNNMSKALQAIALLAKRPKKEKPESEDKQLHKDLDLDMDLYELLMASMVCLGFVAALFLLPILLQ
ncbi:uncharacterized protein LOC134439865 [Engraulis encrasicolus]|uniref:uncharacterized protein LOC134439865 n=1 Tax=Engraulis encrasicolus TaxID=184585 RepID=UPI002FD7326F